MAVPLEREIRAPRGWVPGTGVIPGHAGLAAIQSYAEEGSAGTGFHGLWGATSSSSLQPLSDATSNASAVLEEWGVATFGGCTGPPRDVSNQNFLLPFDSSELLCY